MRAFNADPNDWRTLFAYIRLNDLAAKPLSKGDLEVLTRAYELAPQVAEVVIKMAVALAQSGDTAAAAQVLEPLVNPPHADPASVLAKALRERALAADRAGMAALLRTPRLEAAD